MLTLTTQDPYKRYTNAASTDVAATIAREWERLGQNPPDLDTSVHRNRLRARGFDSAMEQRDAEMRRILDRVEQGAAQPGDLLAIRNYMGL